MSIEELENIDKTINNLRNKISLLEDKLFDVRNINIQYAIILGLENEEIERLLKVSKEEIECFR